jgi:seryl-tRNA synthetase
MSRDFDNIIKEISKSHKELHNVEHKFSKEILDLGKDIANNNKEIIAIKKEIKDIGNKIDNVLEILNTLIVFIEESSDDLPLEEEDNYDSNEGWIQDIDSWQDNYEDDDEDNDM